MTELDEKAAEAGREEPAEQAQRNFTDPESRIMRSGGSFIQGYNSQAAVDANQQIIVAAMLTPMAADSPLLIPMVDLVRRNLGHNPRQLSADTGYCSEANLAGAFAPDPVRGYPPGAPTEPSARPTWQGRVHHVVSGPLAFFAVFGACLAVAASLRGVWQLYTILTAAVGLAMTVWTALAFQRDAARTGLVQRGLLLVYWSWIVALGLHLV